MPVSLPALTVIANQSGPNLAASLLDSNWSGMRSAINGLVPLVTELVNARDYTGTQGWPKGADIADAAAITLGSDGNYFVCNGTTTVTSISSKAAGTIVVLRFAGIRTLTHNATTLILLGATNATTAAGDIYIFISEGGGNWREVWRRPVTNATSAFAFLGNGTFGALGTDVFAGVQGANTTADGATYYQPALGHTFSPVTSATAYAVPVPRAGTARNLRVVLTTAPGGSDTNTLTVYKNGSATALAVAITGASTTGSDLADSVSFAAGDTIMVGNLLTGGSISNNNKWSFEFA